MRVGRGIEATRRSGRTCRSRCPSPSSGWRPPGPRPDYRTMPAPGISPNTPDPLPAGLRVSVRGDRSTALIGVAAAIAVIVAIGVVVVGRRRRRDRKLERLARPLPISPIVRFRNPISDERAGERSAFQTVRNRTNATPRPPGTRPHR